MNLKSIVQGSLELLAKGFDKAPVLNKFKGYRTLIGCSGLLILVILDTAGVGDGTLFKDLSPYFVVFTGLALNSAGRP